ncbi:MAG: hypothetical protein GX937_02870 [Lentisphaerae bacterium]|jgi:hypothetical protein|nr:hypothetical protein [Lentisphaerota bacterium]
MEIELIKFDKATIEVTTIDGQPHVVLKPIADALELDWDAQRRNIRQDPVLNSVTVITTATGADGKQYEMLCLPLKYLNGWLFKVNANRYKGERRALIIRYQRECYGVLAAHFLGRPSSTPTPAGASVPVVRATLADVHAAVERVARQNAAEIRANLAGIAERCRITDADEFATLAAEALEASAPIPGRVAAWAAQYERENIHPSTYNRALARMSQSPFWLTTNKTRRNDDD